MSDMPRPRPYDRRIPARHPAGRSCFLRLAGAGAIAVALVKVVAR